MPWQIIGSAINGLFGNYQVDKQLDAQRNENEAAFRRNKELAAIQNQYNIDQWNRENAYNTPTAQMKRLADAGLNPNLMYGQGNTGNAAQLSGSLSAGSPAVPTDMSPMGRKVSVIGSALDAEMKRAQIRNIDADTKNKSSENKILESDAAFRDALNAGQLDLQSVQIKGLSADIVKTDAETTEIRQRVINLQTEADLTTQKIKEVQASIALTNEKVRTEQLNRVLESQKAKALIQKMAHDMRMSEEQVKQGWINTFSNQTLSTSQADFYDAQTNTFKFDLQERKDAKDDVALGRELDNWDHFVGYARDLASIVGTAFGGTYDDTYRTEVYRGEKGTTTKEIREVKKSKSRKKPRRR